MKKQLVLCIAILLITTGMLSAPTRFAEQVVIDPGQTVQLAHGLGDLPAFTDCLVISGSSTRAPDIMFVPCDQSPYAIEMRIDYRYINVYNPHEFSVTVRVNAER